MKRIVCMLLVLVLVLSAFPVTARAEDIDGEDPILDYGSFDSDIMPQSVEVMSSADERIYEMADIPAGSSYKNMSASQKIVDVIKDFEGFSAKAYKDNGQWSVGYGTGTTDPNKTVTREEAEKLLRKVLINTYEPIVNNFCRKNGKQPTQQQFDALLDFTYNVGGSWTSGTSVPDAVLNPSTALEVVKGFGAWSRSGGKVSYVHVNRRIREALIYLYGEYYLAYGNQDCKSGLKTVGNDDLPHFKVVIFKTNSGKLDNGKTDYAAYYPKGDYYRSFVNASCSGCTLVGWKITKRSNDAVSGSERVSIWDTAEENLELTAVWEKGTFEVEPEAPPASLPFTDVPSKVWYRDAVSYVYYNQLMNGTSATAFAPGGAMTRGMLVTVLYRADGSPAVTDQERACFSDIGGAYYTDAIAWAYANGIVNGVTAKTFEPNRTISRQEAVTIFYRYCAEYKGMAVDSGVKLNGFADQKNVASFAQNAFAWAVAMGLVEGSTTTSGVCLNPVAALNRAEAATLVQRCMEEIL